MTPPIPPGNQRPAAELPPGVILLFSVPIYVFGGYLILHALLELANGRPQQAALTGLAGGLATGVAILIHAGLRTLRRRIMERLARQRDHPEAPWLWRPDWAERTIRSDSRTGTLALVVFAAIWNGLTLPISVLALNQELPKGNRGVLWVLLFPAAGLLLAAAAVHSLLQLRRYGTSILRLADPCGWPGGRLAGAIEVPAQFTPRDGFHVRLRCVRRLTTGSGKNRHTHETTLWEQEQVHTRELLEDDRRRVGIPVHFELPSDVPPSEPRPSNPEIVWRVEASAAVPGVNYRATFEVPVFRLAMAGPDAEEVAEQDAPPLPPPAGEAASATNDAPPLPRA